MAPAREGGSVGRRFLTIRRVFAIVAAVTLATALAACGGNADPYAVLDQARTASYERIQINVGVELEAPPPSIPELPNLEIPGTSVHIDPAWITAAADVPANRYYLRLAIPVDALGQNMGLGMPFASLDLEALTDGTDVYVKSPLLPLYMQGPFGGIGGGAIEGDLTGWVRFSGVGELGPMAPALLGFGLLGGGQNVDIPELPLPSPGNVTALKDLLTEMGATVEHAGTESVDGVELVHLKGGVRIATLAGSRPFLAMTGMSREQVQGLIDMEGKVGISTEIWVNKATGRLATLRINGMNAETPATTVAVILRIAEPGADVTFELPTTFTDIDIAELMGNQFGGIGVGGGVAVPSATMSQEEVEKILEEVGEELEVPATAP
jgi:hypothetical protein